MVVLHEGIWNAALAKSGLTERLCEEPPGVSVPRLLDQDEARELKLNETERHGAEAGLRSCPAPAFEPDDDAPVGVPDLRGHAGVYRCTTPTMLEERETEPMDDPGNKDLVSS